MSKILIVDDEKEIAELISDVLKDEGFETVIMYDGNTAIDEIKKNNNYDLILLDIMMPSISGTEVCQEIRNIVSCPIIFVTAKINLKDKIEGFNVGGDDYITKPFEVQELIARVKAHIRRENRENITSNILQVGEIEINKDSYEVKRAKKNIPLSTKEFELLSFLMDNAGTILSKEQIYNSVWKTEYGDIGTVAVNIKSLRKKLDPEEEYIKTIWGLGYKFIKGKNND